VNRPLRALTALTLSGLLTARAATAQTAQAAPLEPVPDAQPAPGAPPATPQPRSRRPLVFPALRFGFGAHVPVSAPTPSDVSFVFDLHAGIGLFPERSGLSLVPELGYSYDASATRGGHFFTPGLLVMFGSMIFSAGLSGHAVLGDSLGQGAVGVRSALVAQLLATSLTLEVGHQWTSVGGEDRHDFRVIAAINPIPLVLAVIGLSIVSSGARAAGRAFDTATQHPGDLLLPPGQRPVR
jgi:hypothetical protein